MDVPATTSAPAIPAPVTFTGKNGEFRRLVTRGALLELVTFGFYRFWLTTNMRRHLWSRTELDGDALEYTGRGKELLLGFLIAMAVLAPLFLAYFIAGLESARFKAFATLPLYALLFLLGQFAVYRARRYRLTRTVWRGVRFWMKGSGWSFAWRSALWGLLLVPTLGFAYPWRSAALERYKLRHTLYGDLSGRFEATGWQLFKRVWWVWLLGLLPLVLTVAAIVGAIAFNNTATKPPAAAVAFLGSLLLAMLSLVALPFLHAVRLATEWQWWAGGIRFGAVAVACRLRRGSLIGIYWRQIGLSLLVMLCFALLMGGLTFGLGGGVAPSDRLALLRGQLAVWGFAAYAVAYLLMLVALGILARIYGLQRVWQRVAGACAVIDIAAASDVAVAGEMASAFGEGLADGLDFAGL